MKHLISIKGDENGNLNIGIGFTAVKADPAEAIKKLKEFHDNLDEAIAELESKQEPEDFFDDEKMMEVLDNLIDGLRPKPLATTPEEAMNVLRGLMGMADKASKR